MIDLSSTELDGLIDLSRPKTIAELTGVICLADFLNPKTKITTSIIEVSPEGVKEIPSV